MCVGGKINVTKSFGLFVTKYEVGQQIDVDTVANNSLNI